MRPWTPIGAPLAAILTLACPVACQKALEIGTYGARAEPGGKWARKQLDPDLGRDQFAETRSALFGRGSQVFLVVDERRGVFECEADLRRVLDEESTEGHDARVECVEEGTWLRATRTFETTTNNLDLVFRCEVLAKDGLAYHFMYWALRSQRSQLVDRSQAFRKSFEFPGPDSEFAKQLAPAEHEVVSGNMRLSFRARSAMLAKAAHEEGELCQLESADKEQICVLFALDGPETLQQALDRERSRMTEWNSKFTEKARSEQTIDGVGCGRLTGVAEQFCYVTLVVPVAPKRWVYMRYISRGADDVPRPEREAVLASLRVRPLEGGIELPPLGDAISTAAADRTERFCESLPVAAAFDGWLPESATREGEGWLVSQWREVHLVTPSTTTPLLTLESGNVRLAVLWRGELLVSEGGDGVHRVQKGVRSVEPLFRADCAAVVRDDLLLVRSTTNPLPVLASTPTQTLVRRMPSAEETTIMLLPFGGATQLAASQDKRRLAVLGRTAYAHAGMRSGDAWLAEIDLDTRAVTQLGDWHEISGVAATPEGWLVTGTPAGDASGIWLVRAANEREPLLTGTGVLGIGADGASLTFVHRGNERCAIRQVSLERCRAEGRWCQPFAAGHLAAIGRRVMAELGPDAAPRTGADIAAARRSADAIAKAMFGSQLPSVAADVDALVVSCDRDTLSGADRLVLHVLVAAGALDLGARWIESDVVDWTAWQTAGFGHRDTAVATVDDPRRLVTQAIDDTDDQGPPLGGWQSRRAGRTGLMGFDAVALAKHVDAVMPTDLDAALASADVARLAAIFDAAPDNQHLRRVVYGRLTGAGRLDALEALAARRAAGGTAAADDVATLLAVREHRARDAAAAAEVFEAALRAVQQHPREARLYLTLGRAAARAFPQQPIKARQCFDRVLALQTWGAVADAAKRERAALDAK